MCRPPAAQIVKMGNNKKDKSKHTVIFKLGKGSGGSNPRYRRIRRRRMFDWTTEALGNGECNDRVRD
jgi:hypothetical protein